MDIVIYGSGGFGREVLQVVEEINAADERCSLSPSAFNVLGFLDDDPAKVGSTIAGQPVLGGEEWVRANPSVGVVLGPGSPRVKKSIVDRLRPLGVRFPTVAHPTTIVGRNAVVGEGCIFCSRNVLTVDLVVGSFVTVNIGCTITHDDVVGDFVTMAPYCNISGNVQIGEGTDLGTNVLAIPGVRVGSWSILGAGAVVTKDLPDHVTAVGVPAKVISQRTS